jgi:hypothetical protein
MCCVVLARSAIVRLPRPQQNRVGRRVWNFVPLFPNNADCYGHLCLAYRTPPQHRGYHLLAPIFLTEILLVDEESESVISPVPIGTDCRLILS